MKHIGAFVMVIALFLSEGTIAQEARWISYPSANTTQYGVYHFRKTFTLDQVPDSLVIHVSADNRYVLFVNGERIAYGPAKGDLQTYKYDIVDIAAHLKAGENTLAALVYNLGKDKPLNQINAFNTLPYFVPKNDLRPPLV